MNTGESTKWNEMARIPLLVPNEALYQAEPQPVRKTANDQSIRAEGAVKQCFGLFPGASPIARDIAVDILNLLWLSRLPSASEMKPGISTLITGIVCFILGAFISGSEAL
jgi:hypothetical protein